MDKPVGVGGWRTPASDAFADSALASYSQLFFFFNPIPILLLKMRRDRFLVAATLTALFSADLYFILLPKLWTFMQTPGHFCSCGSKNFSLSAPEGLGPPQLSNWTFTTPLDDTTTSQMADGSSKLEKLFAHPLYNIQIPPLAPEESLLQVEQLNEYYMKKVSHWERSVSV